MRNEKVIDNTELTLEIIDMRIDEIRTEDSRLDIDMKFDFGADDMTYTTLGLCDEKIMHELKDFYAETESAELSKSFAGLEYYDVDFTFTCRSVLFDSDSTDISFYSENLVTRFIVTVKSIEKDSFESLRAEIREIIYEGV